MKLINYSASFFYWANDIKFKLLKITTFVLMILIITFNVKGYNILFEDKPLFLERGISPFGLLLAVTELAVLLWTTNVIKNWPSTSRILKSLLIVVVICFGFLSYSGINSYLSTLATSDIRKVQEVKNKKKNNEELIQYFRFKESEIRKELNVIRPEREVLTDKVSFINTQIESINKQASDRRLKAIDCMSSPDCASSVIGFDKQSERLSAELPDLYNSRNRISDRIIKLEDELDLVTAEIQKQKRADILSINKHAGTETDFQMKKRAYESLILTVTAWFNFVPQDPFSVFVSFISFLIYPVYFMLNLLTSLNSEENLAVRNERRLNNKKKFELKKDRKSIRIMILKEIAYYFKLMLLRKKKSTLINLKDKANKNSKRKSQRTELYRKCIRYFRVWAHRRTKVLEVPFEIIKEIEVVVEREVDKIIEVQVEVEKEVEVIKEIIVEKEIEIVREVDRIVEVPTEVEVLIEKTVVKIVEVPYFIKDPQVVIHERIIPVPENVTGAELEEILNAQPELNTDARSEEERFNKSGEGERYSESEQEKERART